nr:MULTISPECIES: non-ribosomal peptide synthetase [Myxococcaceae]
MTGRTLSDSPLRRQPGGEDVKTPELPEAFDPFAGPAILATAPSTEPQRELWTATRLGEDASLAFNESVTLELAGALDLEALRQALSDLLARHEALRATFSGDGLSLMVGAPGPVELPLHDWSARTHEAQAEAWAELLAGEVERPFDLAQGPLFRAQLVRLQPELHRLTLTAHHIVCDGWSTAVVVKDLGQLYSAHRRSSVPQLAPAESFTAYAREQEALVRGPQRAADEAYWVKQFSGELPVLELPFDRARPPTKTYASRRVDVGFDAELVTALKRTGAKHRTSLFSTLLAGFATLLHRLSGQEDVVVGIPSAGQAQGGHDALVGHCVNTLPIRARPSGALPFSELLGQVRTAMLDAQEHQALTFGSLLQSLPLQRDPSRLPLVSVCFNLDKGLSPDALGFEGLQAQLLTNPRHYETFDLFVNAVELDGRLTLECQYNTDLLEERTLRRWLEAYGLLLRHVAQEPATPVGRLPVLPEEDRAQLARWNAEAQAPTFLEDAACVHALIEAQAGRTPQSVAVEFEGARLTYAELDARSNQLARTLRASGVGRGSLVGLCAERSLDMVLGVVAILKAGGAYVPLDPGYPVDRLAYMVADSQMQVLLTQARLHEELKLPAARVLLLDAPETFAGQDASSLPHDAEASAGPEDVAYVIYTSGSTGKPKGVLVPHRAVVNLLRSVQRTPGLSAEDVVLAVTTLSFDIAVSEVLLPLTVGARIVVASRELASDGARLLEALRTHRVTFLDATPATYRLLLGAGWQGTPGLRVICTGEAMPRDLAQELVQRTDAVWNGYGPTETTVWSTFYEVKAPVGRILIGRPVANTDLYVLDAAGEPVPVGVQGELYIGGAGVTHGYLNRPELTKERFVPDRFSGRPGARLYRTGDVVRVLPDGNLECLGRNDHQVKLRGFRIELGEIEDALTQHPRVRQAAVIVREDRPGDRRLVGYTVAQEGAEGVPDAELRAHLKRTLPDYMVPGTWVRLPKMPLTPSGKIDRRALPAPQAPEGGTGADFVAPRTPTETLLAGLWKEALNVGRLSVHDDFFALGGHSLLASQVLARLRRDHGIQLSFRKMFEAPTIARFAELVDQQSTSRESAPPAVTGVPKRQGTGPAPVSGIQERLWLLEEMDPSQRLIHNLPAAWRLKGALDAGLLERCLNELVQRHDTLRTTFSIVGGQRVQLVHPAYTLKLAQEDLSALPGEERERVLDARMAEATRELFDLSALPLFRATLYRLAEDEHVLYTLRHNTIWDGWSFDIFLNELAALYTAYAAGKPSPLQPLPVTYADFTEWHRGWLEGQEIARQREWWRTQLGGSPPALDLPTDRPRSRAPTHAGANEGVKLTKVELDALTQLAQRAGGTLYMVVFSAFNALLHRYTGQTDLLVGTPVRARSQPELEGLIGPFVNAVVLRTRVRPEMSFLELVKSVRDTTLDAFGNQDLPLERLGGRPPIVRAFFSLQDAKNRPKGLGEVSISQVHVLPPAAADDMMLWMMEGRDGLLAMLNYSTELFDQATAQRFLQQLRTLLSEVVRDPTQSLARLRLLPEAESAALQRAGHTPHALQGPALLHRRFQAQAAATPDASALRVGGQVTSYAQLAQQASRLARALLARAGAAPLSKVALLLEPAALPAALLATLEAGASAVLLDPRHPRPWLQRQLEAAAPGLLLTTRALKDALAPAQPAALLVDEDAALIESHCAGALPEVSAQAAALESWSAEGTGALVPSRVSHLTLSHLLEAVSPLTGLEAGASAVHALSPAHESAALELLLPLTRGAALEVPASGEPEALLGALGTPGAHWLAAPPATLQTLVAAGWKGAPGLRGGCLGPASAELAPALRTRAPAGAWSLHGWPAAGGLAFARDLSREDVPHALGRPLPGWHAEVLETTGSLSPTGVPGALRLTAPGAEAWASGERARLRADGVFELLERPEAAALVGGLRAHPAQLEGAMRGHPAVADAAAAAHPDRLGELRWVGYVVPRPGESVTATELRRHLRRLVPEALVPQAVVELEALPARDDGSVDRTRLASPYKQQAHEYVAPRTDAERLLAGLWTELLGTQEVGVHDNFFALGGYSLLCFQLIGKVAERTGKRLNPRLFLLDTLEQVAAQLGPVQQQAAAAAAPVAAAAPAPAAPAASSGGLFGKLKGMLKK